MNENIPILFQSLLITLFLFSLSITWASLCSSVASCFRRDRNIVGQNLILTSIGFLGIFAVVNDQSGTHRIIAASHTTVYLLVLMLIGLWIFCSRLVKKILITPVNSIPVNVIIGVRWFINFCGIISVVGCRFLLTRTLPN